MSDSPNYSQIALERVRLLLAGSRGLLLLSMLGLICGILAGGVIIIFRLVIESSQISFLPGADP